MSFAARVLLSALHLPDQEWARRACCAVAMGTLALVWIFGMVATTGAPPPAPHLFWPGLAAGLTGVGIWIVLATSSHWARALLRATRPKDDPFVALLRRSAQHPDLPLDALCAFLSPHTKALAYALAQNVHPGPLPCATKTYSIIGSGHIYILTPSTLLSDGLPAMFPHPHIPLVRDHMWRDICAHQGLLAATAAFKTPLVAPIHTRPTGHVLLAARRTLAHASPS